MSVFCEIKLGDAVTFQRGFDITEAEQTPGRVPIVSSSGIKSSHNKAKVEGPGVIIGRKGTLGSVHFVTQDYWPHDTTLWVKDFKGNVLQFVAYFLRMLKLENFDTGASNPTLNRNHIHKIKVLFPKEHDTQRKIAAILTAYDDLIETNKCRITLLEKMAEELYREWFVRMRFPGYQNTKFVKGLPAEWGTKRINTIVERKKFGRIFKPAELVDEGSIIVIDQSRLECLGYYEGKPEHKASPDSPILLFGDHSCKMVFMTRPFSLAENVIPFTPKSDMPAYLLYHLIKDLAKTTEYKRHWTDLVNREVLIPRNELQLKFRDFVRDNHVMREDLVKANRNLTKTRDLLLPRLISGKLSVEDLNIQFPPSMQEETTEPKPAYA